MPLRFPRYDEEKSKGVSDKILSRIVERINKKYKGDEESVVTTLGDSVFSQPRGYISSGILPIDCIVCYGLGFPTGIIEIYGGEASGKTAILENTLAESQRRGYYAALFPTEYSLNYRRVQTVGLDENKLLICEAETIEDVYDQLRYIVNEIRKSDQTTPIVFGWDTVAATPTRSELEHKAGLEASDMGRAAQQMSKLFRRLVRFLFVNKVCLICVNQTRTNLGVMYGNRESTFGGKALKFYAWVRCRVARVKNIKGPDDEEIGFICELRCVKNKVAPPERRCRIPIFWTRGVDPVLAIWEFAIDQKIFERKGTAYKYNGQVLTRNSFPKFYKHHKKEIDGLLRKSTVGEE